MDNAESRLFIALPLPSDLQEELAVRCKRLSRSISFKKWVHKEDLHITLQFLGAVPINRIAHIEQSMRELSLASASFDLSIQGLGSFGLAASPRILWAGLSGDIAALKQLQQSVVRAMTPHGFPGEDRPYRPHITLAKHFRGNDGGPDALHQGMSSEDWDSPLGWSANEIVLFETHMSRSPMYERLFTFPLGAPFSGNIRDN
ncbi:RNA 2',3'-cyclic phosphodiesterase [Gorillibacterium massiliense]|uniref:RNA 2',3'-cyclic phosphodiesterase n=1 Tax=Gorillibacterium massiliense TaxID=1280390 RepID=UPI0004B373AA|nr:RNA 2',3'-cyclic phosphodiesterase [Gorillibacterium massiliense]